MASTEMTTKQLFAFVGSLMACMAGAATLHSVLVVPAIMNEVIKVVDAEVSNHEARPHTQAVSREEFTLILHRMDNLATKSDVLNLADRIQDMNMRLQRLESQ